MRHRFIAVLFVALLFPGLAIGQGPSVLAIRAARPIDGKSTAMVMSAVILVEAAKITNTPIAITRLDGAWLRVHSDIAITTMHR